MAIYGALISVVEQTPAMLVGTIDENSINLPTARPDGSDFQDGDYVKIKPSAVVPFTVNGVGGPFTINSINDILSFARNEMKWYLNPSSKTQTKDVEVVSKDNESISKTATTQEAINRENVGRLNQVLQSGEFSKAAGTHKLKLKLTKYKEVSPATEPVSYETLVNEELLCDTTATEDSEKLIESDAVWEEILKTSDCKLEYKDHKLHLYLVNNRGEAKYEANLNIDQTATENSTNTIESNAVWKEVLKTDDCKFEIDSGTHKVHLLLKNNKSSTLIDKSIAVDEVPAEGSHNLICSAAVYNSWTEVSKNKFQVDTTGDNLVIQSTSYDGSTIWNSSVTIDQTATESSKNIANSGSVYNAQTDNDNSSITFIDEEDNITKKNKVNVPSNASSKLRIVLKDRNDNTLVDQKVDFGGVLVMRDKEQTLTKKTLDFDATSEDKNIATNLPLDAFAKQTSADEKKILQVQGAPNYELGLSFLNIIKEVATLPTAQDNENILLHKTGEKKVYYWNTDNSTYQSIGGGGIMKVASLPATDIDSEVIYAVEEAASPNTYIHYWIYDKTLAKWYEIYTDKYGGVVYEDKEQTIKNKTFEAKDQEELDLFIELAALPTSDAKKCLYYDTVNQEVKFSRDGGASWHSFGGDAFERVTALPTTGIKNKFYLLDTQTILLGRYSVKNTSTSEITDRGLLMDGVLHSNYKMSQDFDSYKKFFKEDPQGELKLYGYAYKNDKILTTKNADEADGMYYFHQRATTWIRIGNSDVDNVTIEYNADVKLQIKDAGVTGVKLNTDVVDDDTIALASNKIQLKNGGITSVKCNSSFLKTTITEESTDTEITTSKGVYDFVKTFAKTLSADTANKKLQLKDSGGNVLSEVSSTDISDITKDDETTLTNKTLDLDNNTLTNIETDNFKSGVIETTSISQDEQKIPCSAIVKTELDKKLNLSGGTMTGVIDMGSNKITNLATPTDANDVVNKTYVDEHYQPKITFGTTDPSGGNDGDVYIKISS